MDFFLFLKILFIQLHTSLNEGKISEYSKLVGRKRTRIYYHIEDEGINYLEQLSNNYNNTINGVKTILDSLN